MTSPGASARRVVVTRAREDAPDLLRFFQAHGWAAEGLPLLDLQNSPAAQLDAGAEVLTEARSIMVVSARAAQALGRADLSWGAALREAWAQGRGPRVWSPGLGTVAALVALGVPRAQIDCPPEDAAQFDSEHLWPLVKAQLRGGDRVVFLRGEGAVGGTGRDFLWQRCVDAGAQPQALWVYQRGMPHWTPQERAAFARLRMDAQAVWLFSSSLALQHWQALDAQGFAQAAPAQARQSAWALTTHARITQTAQALGWVHVAEATPRRDDLLETLAGIGFAP